ncbi:hypothetical protein C8Q77DRAFT_1131907 [Trametes polyzona]|nr:hypothetical protein C8Q77DRAFT_1131907 [Trametes polyzona]
MTSKYLATESSTMRSLIAIFVDHLLRVPYNVTLKRFLRYGLRKCAAERLHRAHTGNLQLETSANVLCPQCLPITAMPLLTEIPVATTNIAGRSAETTPLLNPISSIHEVEQPRYRDILRAMNTMTRSFTDNTLLNYLNSADTAPFSVLRRWLARFLTFASSVYQKRMLTIDGGTAFLIYGPPGKNRPPWFVRFLLPILNSFRPAELVKRRNEYSAKVKAQIHAAFGEAVDEMYEIQGLATAPEAQGRGYGKRLVKAVTDMGDAEGRDVWVVTSDARRFYEVQGFRVESIAVPGVDNPRWSGGPVHVHIMRRVARPAGQAVGLDIL